MHHYRLLIDKDTALSGYEQASLLRRLSDIRQVSSRRDGVSVSGRLSVSQHTSEPAEGSWTRNRAATRLTRTTRTTRTTRKERVPPGWLPLNSTADFNMLLTALKAAPPRF